MNFHSFDQERLFREAWEAVHIARPVQFTLFTFGHTELPYYLVCEAPREGGKVSVTRGDVRIDRPRIVTPDSAQPELKGFFEARSDEEVARFLLARTAHFSNLKLANRGGDRHFVSDSVDDTVARLNRQLDAEEEDRVAILVAPEKLGGIAVLRYAAERVLQSAPGNIQELRERGFLPD